MNERGGGRATRNKLGSKETNPKYKRVNKIEMIQHKYNFKRTKSPVCELKLEGQKKGGERKRFAWLAFLRLGLPHFYYLDRNATCTIFLHNSGHH